MASRVNIHLISGTSSRRTNVGARVNLCQRCVHRNGAAGAVRIEAGHGEGIVCGCREGEGLSVGAPGCGGVEGDALSPGLREPLIDTAPILRPFREL